MKKICVVLIVGLVFVTAACGPFAPEISDDNQVRLAVYAYEREHRGQTDDLIIHYNRVEPRVRFDGQAENGGRTVWLFSMAAKEYFALLPPERTYLYIQEIEFNGSYDEATVPVYRGDGGGYVGREFFLAKNGDQSWQVIEEQIIK